MKRNLRSIAAAAAVALLLTACGTNGEEAADEPAAADSAAEVDDADEGGGGSTDTVAVDEGVIDAARTAVEAARQRPSEFQPPSVEAGEIRDGTSLAAITAINAAPLPYQGAEEVVRAAELIGWDGQIIDGQGSPANWERALRSALTGGADAIAFSAVQPSLIPEATSAAHEEGVSMAVFVGCEPELPDGVDIAVPSNRYDEGYLLGQWVIQDSPDGAEILLLDNHQFTCLEQSAQGFRDAIQEAGPSFQIVAEAESPQTDQSGATGVQRLSALLREHESASYFFLMQEDWTPVFQEAMRSVGRDDVVGLAMDWKLTVPMIREHGNIVSAGREVPYQAWTMVYGLLAGTNGIEVEEHDAPIYLVDSTNVDEVEGDLPSYGFDVDAAWHTFLTTDG